MHETAVGNVRIYKFNSNINAALRLPITTRLFLLMIDIKFLCSIILCLENRNSTFSNTDLKYNEERGSKKYFCP